MPKISLAITGTIGSGKSTVSNIIRKYNLSVYDADVESKKILSKNTQGYYKCIELFPNILDNDSNIDRKKLAKIIFNDNVKKNQLEEIIHPLIQKDIINKIQNCDVFIAEIPLLFEKGFDTYFDEKLLIVSDLNIVQNRLLNKGMNLDEINARINNQFSIEKKKKLATYIIENNDNIENLEVKVLNYLKLLKIL